MIDLKRIKSSMDEPSTNPRELFSSIPNRTIRTLRPSQTEVLKQWYDRREAVDLVIQMNAGSGKTLVGLLICHSSQIELERPSIYLCPTKQLVSQVLNEAADNGIPATSDENDSQFLMAKRVLVTTAHKLFNGRSVFKRLTDRGIRFGRIVVDDAQTTIRAICNQFIIKVGSDSELFRRLLVLFEEDIKFQEPMAFERLSRRDDLCQYVEVSPHTIWEKREALTNLLYSYEREDDVLFSLPLIGATLAFSSVTFSSYCVEIAAPCPDVEILDAYGKAKGHVFLSATYSSINELVINMAVNEESILPVISPESASDCGDRMILSTHAIDAHLIDHDIRTFVAQVAVGNRIPNVGRINIVVLVSSENRARLWQHETGGRIAVRDEVEKSVAELCDGRYEGILIVVNRYDGIDLPGDACRLLVLDGIAGHFVGREHRRARALYNTPVHQAVLAHKLEQGIGRGIRGEDDYCAVLLIGGELEMATHKRDRVSLLSPVLQRQLRLSRQIEDQIPSGPDALDGIAEAFGLFLTRNAEWDRLRSKGLSDAVYASDWTYNEVSVARGEAFRLAKGGNFNKAADVLRHGIDTVDNDEERGWFMEELSRYVQQYDGVQSQAVLEKAHTLNGVVVKPRSSVSNHRNRGKNTQAASIVSNLSHCGSTDMVIGSLCGDIGGFVWGEIGNAERDEQIIQQVGASLGFLSNRPEKESRNGGPDNLWQTPDSCVFSIELKADVWRSNPCINKDEIGQTHSSLAWSENKYPYMEIIPVIVHPSRALTENATAPRGLRVINQRQLTHLFESLERFAHQIARGEGWKSEQEVQKALQDNHLVGKDAVMHFSSPVK